MKLTLLALLLCSTSAIAQSWTLTPRGPACGGNLRGQVVAAPQGTALRLGIDNAAPSAFAVLAIGMPQASPVALPSSHCLLYVDARATQLSSTDARGQAGFALRLPPRVPLPFTFHLQGVVIEPSRMGRIATSTNVLQVDGV